MLPDTFNLADYRFGADSLAGAGRRHAGSEI